MKSKLILLTLFIAGCSTQVSSLNEQQLLQKALQGQGRAQFAPANRLAGKAQPDYRAAAQVAMWYEQELSEPKAPEKTRSWWQFNPN